MSRDGSLITPNSRGVLVGGVYGDEFRFLRVGDTGALSMTVDNPDPLPVTLDSTIPLPTYFGRTASVDAFNRLRVSFVRTLIDLRYDINDLSLLTTTSTSGGGTVARNANLVCMELKTTTASGDSAVLQSKRIGGYRPGKSLLTVISFNYGGAETNVRKRVGLFTASNGVFSELTSAGLSLNIRSSTSGSPVENSVPQASWNLDTLDGNGPSGYTLDVTKNQILAIDLQWLGSGQVRVGYVINGELIYAHLFNHSNVLETVYMQTANLPLRAEITNTGTASGTPTFYFICGNVSIEGGEETAGIRRSVDRGITLLVTNRTLAPLISLRLKSTELRAVIELLSYNVMASTSGADFRAGIYLNPTITGGTAASWVSVDGSSAEYDVSRTGTVSGGYLLHSIYSSQEGQNESPELGDLLALGQTLADVRDELVLAVQTIDGPNESFFGNFSFRDVI